MLRRVVCVFFAVLGLVVGLWAVPAVAAGEGAPVFVTPADGSTMKEWDGSWSVDFTDAPVGSYRVTVYRAYSQETYVVDTTVDTTVVSEQHDADVEFHHRQVTIEVFKADDSSVYARTTFQVIGYQQPELLSPDLSTGTTYNWDGRVRIDFSGARQISWQVVVQANDYDFYKTKYVTYDGVHDIVTVDFPVAGYAGQFRIDIGNNGPSNFWRDYEFRNVLTPRVSGVSAEADSFYPTVRDGFRDSVAVRFDIDRSATVRMAVYDADGRRVYRDATDVRRAGTHHLRWSGRTAHGWAKPGRYRITLSAGPSGAESSDSTSVQVVTDFVTDRRTVVRAGTQTSSRRVHGDCYLSGYDGELTIDCWGIFSAASAEVRYGFRLPSSATDLHWDMRGTVGCCDTGVIERGVRRTSATNAYVFAHLTRARAYTVRRVELSYAYQRKR